MDDWGGPVEQTWVQVDARPAADNDVRGASGRQSRLVDVLKRELLPRLVEARRKPPAAKQAAPANPDALAESLVSGRLSAARALIAARLDSGATPQAIALEDIAPAARKLGEYWRNDDCDFAEVTIAAAALRNMLRDATPDDPPRPACAPSIMVSTAPGETHVLGADIVCGAFRRAGWRTARCDFDEGLGVLERESFDVAGFSLSCDRFAEALGRAIAEARDVSKNRRLAILVGGPVFASNPGLAACLGADVCASDVDLAPHFPSSIQRALRL